MKDGVRCAVLGLGRLGRLHAENLAARIKGAKLEWVVDPMPGIAEKAASELGARWTLNPDDVFHDDKVDAVVIATPTSTHGEMIRKAAEAGKHIFVEKPLALTMRETEEAIQAVSRRRVVCQVGFMRRFDPAYAEAKRQIDAGAIGSRSTSKACPAIPARRRSRSSREAAGFSSTCPSMTTTSPGSCWGPR